MTAHATPDDAATRASGATEPSRSEQQPRTERVVEQAARESFPASDPPSFTPMRAMGSADSTRADDPPIEQDAHRESMRQWGMELCRAFDACDAEAVGTMLAEDAVVRIGMAPLLVGREAAQRWLANYFTRVGSVIHHVTDTRVDGDALVVESEVNVRTADGAKMMVPEAISVRLRGQSAARLTVYGGPVDVG